MFGPSIMYALHPMLLCILKLHSWFLVRLRLSPVLSKRHWCTSICAILQFTSSTLAYHWILVTVPHPPLKRHRSNDSHLLAFLSIRWATIIWYSIVLAFTATSRMSPAYQNFIFLTRTWTCVAKLQMRAQSLFVCLLATSQYHQWLPILRIIQSSAACQNTCIYTNSRFKVNLWCKWTVRKGFQQTTLIQDFNAIQGSHQPSKRMMPKPQVVVSNCFQDAGWFTWC